MPRCTNSILIMTCFTTRVLTLMGTTDGVDPSYPSFDFLIRERQLAPAEESLRSRHILAALRALPPF